MDNVVNLAQARLDNEVAERVAKRLKQLGIANPVLLKRLREDSNNFEDSEKVANRVAHMGKWFIEEGLRILCDACLIKNCGRPGNMEKCVGLRALLGASKALSKVYAGHGGKAEGKDGPLLV